MWFHPSYCLCGASPLLLDMGYLFLVNSIFIDTDLLFINRVGRIFENYNLRLQRKYNIYVQISGFIKEVMTLKCLFFHYPLDRYYLYACTHSTDTTYTYVTDFFFSYDTRAKRNYHQVSEISVLLAQSNLYHLRSHW